MTTETTFLKSKANPSGVNLEDILQTIADDLKIKNAALDPEDGESKLVMNNNTVIIQMLENSIEIQNRSLDIMGIER